MTNKQTDCIVALLFSFAFFGTFIYALILNELVVAILGLILSTVFAFISFIETK